VVDDVGVTFVEPLAHETVPTPLLIEQVVAFTIPAHVNTADWPGAIVVGFAVNVPIVGRLGDGTVDGPLPPGGASAVIPTGSPGQLEWKPGDVHARPLLLSTLPENAPVPPQFVPPSGDVAYVNVPANVPLSRVPASVPCTCPVMPLPVE
jgi:hypothetical protein